MKKFLLLAVAALVAVSADAQLSKKMKSGKLQARQQVEQKATFSKKYEIAGAKKDVKAVLDKTSKMFKGTVKATNIKPVAKQYKSNRAAAVQEVYEGYGMQRSTSETVDWEMKSGTATLESGEEISLLQNVIPDIFGFEDGVVVVDYHGNICKHSYPSAFANYLEISKIFCIFVAEFCGITIFRLSKPALGIK